MQEGWIRGGWGTVDSASEGHRGQLLVILEGSPSGRLLRADGLRRFTALSVFTTSALACFRVTRAFGERRQHDAPVW